MCWICLEAGGEAGEEDSDEIATLLLFSRVVLGFVLFFLWFLFILCVSRVSPASGVQI